MHFLSLPCVYDRKHTFREGGNLPFLHRRSKHFLPIGCQSPGKVEPSYAASTQSNFASYQAKISKGFYAGVQTMTVHIIEVEYGNCGFAVSQLLYDSYTDPIYVTLPAVSPLLTSHRTKLDHVDAALPSVWGLRLFIWSEMVEYLIPGLKTYTLNLLLLVNFIVHLIDLTADTDLSGHSSTLGIPNV